MSLDEYVEFTGPCITTNFSTLVYGILSAPKNGFREGTSVVVKQPKLEPGYAGRFWGEVRLT